MANATKLPSGSWRVRACYTKNGKKCVRSFTVDPKECGGDSRKAKALAELKASQWIASFEEEKFYNLTVRKALDNYILDNEGVLSPNSVRAYRQYIQYFDDIADMKVDAVRNTDIQPLISQMARKVKPKTVKDRISFLLSALDYAGCDRKFRLNYPEGVPRNTTTPDHDQISALLGAADDVMKGIICLAAFYSLRRGEICALDHSDISRDMGSVYIHRSMAKGPDGEWIVKDIPKTAASIRTVYPIPEVMALLPSSGSGDGFLFSSFSNDQIRLNPDALERKWTRLKKKAGVDIRFHDLRHYAASFRSDIDIPLKYTGEVGGWSKGSHVLTDVYDNTLNSSRKKFTQKANDWITSTFSEELKHG